MYVQFVQSTQDAENGGIYTGTEISEKLNIFSKTKIRMGRGRETTTSLALSWKLS
jgi:hypothetical protein